MDTKEQTEESVDFFAKQVEHEKKLIRQMFAKLSILRLGFYLSFLIVIYWYYTSSMDQLEKELSSII